MRGATTTRLPGRARPVRRWTHVVARGAALGLALSTLLPATRGSAQQFAGTLTLQEALQLAREHNPGFQRVRNDLGVAATGVRAAWAAAFLPSVGSSLNFNGSHRTTVTGEDPFGVPVRLPQPQTSSNSSASQSINTEITLFDGFSSIRGLHAQRAMYDATEAQIQAQAVQLTAQVSREYFQAVKAARLIQLEQALLASARERLLRSEELLRIAARNRVDVLGARADVADSEQNVARARGEADKARLSLAATLGIDPATSITLDTVLPAVFDPSHLEAATLVGRALSTSPVMHQRQAALAAARHRAAGARGRRLPSLTANAGYGRSVNQAGYGAFGEINPLNYGFNFGVRASLPLFSRFQTSATIAEAAAGVQDAESDLRAAQLTVERDVRMALIDLENAYRALVLAEQNVALSRERLELTQEQYRLGGVNFTELQNVIDRTAQAERKALDERFQVILARLNLEEKLGARLEG